MSPGAISTCTSSRRFSASLDALAVRAGLVAGEDVIDAAEVVRALDHLQAAVLARGRVDRDEGAAQQREQDAVLIPVAVVLVPRPGAADARVLHDHLRVVVVDLAAEQLLGRVHDGFAARDHAVDGVARMVPQGEPDRAAFAVGAAEGVLVERAVFAGGLGDEADFFGGRTSRGRGRSRRGGSRGLDCQRADRKAYCFRL